MILEIPLSQYGSRGWIRAAGATVALVMTIAMLSWINFLAGPYVDPFVAILQPH